MRKVCKLKVITNTKKAIPTQLVVDGDINLVGVATLETFVNFVKENMRENYPGNFEKDYEQVLKGVGFERE